MVQNTKNQNKFIEEAIIMKEQSSSVQNTGGLKPHLSSLAVWALSVGSAIGWALLSLPAAAIFRRRDRWHPFWDCWSVL